MFQSAAQLSQQLSRHVPTNIRVHRKIPDSWGHVCTQIPLINVWSELFRWPYLWQLKRYPFICNPVAICTTHFKHFSTPWEHSYWKVWGSIRTTLVTMWSRQRSWIQWRGVNIDTPDTKHRHCNHQVKIAGQEELEKNSLKCQPTLKHDQRWPYLGVGTRLAARHLARSLPTNTAWRVFMLL